MISTKHAHEKIGTETQYRTTWFGGRGPARGGAEGAKGGRKDALECGIAEQAFQYLHLRLGIHVRSFAPSEDERERMEGRRTADRLTGRKEGRQKEEREEV